MSVSKFKSILIQRLNEESFRYLINKRGEKGSEIEYQQLEMAEYLQPGNFLSIENKRKSFSLRNQMLDIPSNFISREKNKSKCICKSLEDMRHVYECKYLNIDEPSEKYEQLFRGNINQQISVLHRFEYNIEKRENYANNIESEEIDELSDHRNPKRVPLFTVMDNKKSQDCVQLQ